jgi:tRNA G26 N,N-dimethylase Trm1
MHEDNLNVLKGLNDAGEKYDLIDLDPFVTCREQMDLTWDLLNDRSALFITFGGEYRRSFIGTNRKAIARRYGFSNDTLSNSDYLEIIPAFFYGWVAQQSSKNGFILEIDYCVRYPNYCRFWTRSRKATAAECKEWYENNVEERDSGYLWKDLIIPRFAEVRYRTDELIQGIPYTPKTTKKRKSKAALAPQMELKM